MINLTITEFLQEIYIRENKIYPGIHYFLKSPYAIVVETPSDLTKLLNAIQEKINEQQKSYYSFDNSDFTMLNLSLKLPEAPAEQQAVIQELLQVSPSFSIEALKIVNLLPNEDTVTSFSQLLHKYPSWLREVIIDFKDNIPLSNELNLLLNRLAKDYPLLTYLENNTPDSSHYIRVEIYKKYLLAKEIGFNTLEGFNILNNAWVEALENSECHPPLRDFLAYEIITILQNNANFSSAYQVAEKISDTAERQTLQAEIIGLDKELPLSPEQRTCLRLYLTSRPESLRNSQTNSFKQSICQNSFFAYKNITINESSSPTGLTNASFLEQTGAVGAISCKELDKLVQEVAETQPAPQPYTISWFYNALSHPSVIQECLTRFGTVCLIPLEQMMAEPQNVKFLGQNLDSEAGKKVLKPGTQQNEIEDVFLPKVAGFYVTDAGLEYAKKGKVAALQGLEIAAHEQHNPSAYRGLAEYYRDLGEPQEALNCTTQAFYYDGYYLTNEGKDILKEEANGADSVIAGINDAIEQQTIDNTHRIELALFLAEYYWSKEYVTAPTPKMVPYFPRNRPKKPQEALSLYKKAVEIQEDEQVIAQVIEQIITLGVDDADIIAYACNLLDKLPSNTQVNQNKLELYTRNLKTQADATKIEELLLVLTDDATRRITYYCLTDYYKELPVTPERQRKFLDSLCKEILADYYFEPTLEKRQEAHPLKNLYKYFNQNSHFQYRMEELKEFLEPLTLTLMNHEELYSTNSSDEETYIRCAMLYHQYPEKLSSNFYANSAKAFANLKNERFFTQLPLLLRLSLIYHADDFSKEVLINHFLAFPPDDWTDFFVALGDFPESSGIILSIAQGLLNNHKIEDTIRSNFFNEFVSRCEFKQPKLSEFFLQNQDAFLTQPLLAPEKKLKAANFLCTAKRYTEAIKYYTQLSSETETENANVSLIAKRRLNILTTDTSDSERESFETLWRMTMTDHQSLAQRLAMIFDHYERQNVISRNIVGFFKTLRVVSRKHGDTAKLIASTLRQNPKWDAQDILTYLGEDSLCETLKNANPQGRMIKMLTFVEGKCLDVDTYHQQQAVNNNAKTPEPANLSRLWREFKYF